MLAPPPQMVSEDFAYYQQRIPGFYFFVGVGNPAKGITAMWHTEYYDMDEDALRRRHARDGDGGVGLLVPWSNWLTG